MPDLIMVIPGVLVFPPVADLIAQVWAVRRRRDAEPAAVAAIARRVTVDR